MKYSILVLIIFLTLNATYASIENYQHEVETLIRSKFLKPVFKIDNSFVSSKNIYLPLIPDKIKKVEKLSIVYSVYDGTKINPPRALILSNGIAYVRLLMQKDNTFTILNVHEIPSDFRSEFMKLRFPEDLVVPENLLLKKEHKFLVGDLPLTIDEANKKPDLNLHNATGYLFLTSPDTGKVVHFDLMDLSMIYHFETKGAPYELAYLNSNLYVTDFGRDKIYKFSVINTNILKSHEINLPGMSNPIDVKISEDHSKIYVLNSYSNDISAYSLNEEKYLYGTNLIPGPNSVAFFKKTNQIAITCPATGKLILLNENNFSGRKSIPIKGGPEKIITDLNNEYAFITLRNKGSISKFHISSAKVLKEIVVGDTPVSGVISSDGKFLYVANAKSNNISIVDLTKEEVTQSIDLPIETQFPGDLALTKDDSYLVITSETTNIISIIDLKTKQIAVKLDIGATTHGALLLDGK